MYLAPIRRLIIAIIIINVGSFLYKYKAFSYDTYFAPEPIEMLSRLNSDKEVITKPLEEVINDEVVEEIKLSIEDTLNKFKIFYIKLK
ncbi:hypothetical protein [Campylobacter canadensis]|uniref:hypothetical protein n=1 Tax=Campylobacter canadensis TaxID=449520 RepID=UPI001CCEDAEE|nr:hypothetical protein [Campylobacter canadensis]MBZ8002398.1 hypothetical protein [Campylobacter canadensis]